MRTFHLGLSYLSSGASMLCLEPHHARLNHAFSNTWTRCTTIQSIHHARTLNCGASRATPLPYECLTVSHILSTPKYLSHAMPAMILFHLNFSDPELDFVSNPASTDPSWIRVTVEGMCAVTEVSLGLLPVPSCYTLSNFCHQLYLPTDALNTLEDAYWGNWISTIQGPVMGRCDVTLIQCQLLLDVVLAYRAFTSGTACMPDIWYTNLVCLLINIAHLHPNHAIDEPLMTLTNSLCSLLPSVCTDSIIIHSL